MVLESLVADLLNRYLGDFVVNLDPKQLNLGIWGGDVKLTNLQLKSSALDDLDLPFNITHGRLSNLVLKIPWKNLYKQPVVVTVSGLYLVAVPKTGVQYNKEKEEKEAVDAKQRQLRRLEDAKKLHKDAGDAASQQNDSFVEKMATTIIKNLQVDVSDIHIRFEDKFSSPSMPFACGVTLKTLRFVTTEDSWMGSVITDAAKFVYKLVSLEALSLYWSPSLKESFNDMNEEELVRAFKDNIADKDKIPSLSYILEPIHLKCNLRLNPKPELDGSDFQIPKIDLRLSLEALALSLSRRQYEGIVLFADALDTMTLKSKYRKYLPSDHPVKQGLNAKEWWHYAQRCVLEADVKPRLQGWSWSHIKAHREKLRRYRLLYTHKMINPKQTPTAIEELDALERDLTTFNIVLMRQQAEVDAKKLKPAVQEQAGGWWGWMTGKGKQPQLGEGDLEKQLADIMSPEEKKKLYEAIDYREGAPIAMYPTTFVENRFDVKLRTLALSVVDDSQHERSSVLVVALNDVQSQVEQRPSAGGLKVNAAIKDFNILGTDKRTKRPELMVPAKQGDSAVSSLLEVLFETKPLDSNKEYLLKVVASPVKAVYDAETINDIAKFFQPPESLHLKQLQVTAAAKLQELRESSTAGLRYALEVHKEIDLNIHLNASYFIVPEKGIFTETAAKLIFDLGDIRIGNIDVPDRALKRGEENLEKLEASLYDKYSVDFQKIQVIFAETGDKWEAARKAGITPLHILQPLSCALEIHQCILQNDPKRPMLRLLGELPSIAVHITEERVVQLCRLALSVPLPESSPETPSQASKDIFKKDRQREAMSMARSNKDLKVAQQLFLGQSSSDEDYQDSDQESAGDGEIFFDAVDATERSPKPKRRKSFHSSSMTPRLKAVEANFTSFHMQFRLNEVSLSIYRGRSEVPLVKFLLSNIITEVYTRTFDMQVGLALVDLVVDYTRQSTNETVKMLRRHQGDTKGLLLRLDYTSAKSNAPDFETTYNKTLQRLQADFVGLDIVLDREGLVEIKQFAADLQEQVNALIPTNTEVKAALDEPDVQKEGQATLVGQKSAGVIQLDISAKLHMLTLSLLTGRKELAYCALKDISATVVSDSEKMDVNAQLKQIKLKYPLALGLYPHIVRSLSDEVLSVHYTGYTTAAVKTDVTSHDMAVQLTLGAVQIVFLNKFVLEVVDFFAGFQTAQAKLMAVTSTATESAMQSLQSAYADAVRIKMDISIRAPVVIMPQHSRSNNAVLADLGTLVLRNSFYMTPEKAVMDEMKLNFAAVKLSRVIMGANQTIVKEIPLLHQPQAMEMSVVRNLSGLWFTGAPDMSVEGGLKSLELRLSKFDYAILMAVLADNFAEGSPAAPPPSRSFIENSTLTTPVPTQVSSSKLPTGVPAGAASSTRSTKIQVNFSVGKISARLYLIDLPDIKEEKELDQAEALCGAEIVDLEAHVEMFNDNSMIVTAALANITLDDLRAKSQNRHHRMLERKSKSSQGGPQNSKMLRFVMQQLANSDRNIDVVVASIQCNLAISFYMGILQFITSTPAEEPEKPLFEISEIGTSISSGPRGQSFSEGLRPPGSLSRRTSRNSTSKDMSPNRPNPAVQAVRPSGIMRVSVLVEHPEIILIEDPALKDSRILVLKTELSFKMTVTPDTSNMDLACNQLQIFLTTYEKRTELLKQILMPVEIGLHGNTPFGGGQKLAISMGYVNLTISPVAVQTILAVLSSMGQTGTQEVKVHETQNHLELWKPKAVLKDAHWFLNDTLEDEWMEILVENALDTMVDDVLSAGDHLSLTTDSIVIVFETSFGTRTVPMLLLEAKFNCTVEDFSRKMHCVGNMQLEVAYYNDLFDVWEPLLEPVEDVKSYRSWQAQIDVRKNITADENVQTLARMAATSAVSPSQMIRRSSSGSVTASSTSMTSVSESSEALKRTAAMTVTVSSMDSLQLTVSKRTLDVIFKMVDSFTAAISSQEMMKVTLYSAPYVVFNDTGLDMIVIMTGSLRFADVALQEYALKQGEKMDLFLTDSTPQLTASVLRMQERMNIRPPMIQVKVGSKVADILVSRAETRFYFIENPQDQSKPYRLIAEIQSEMGHKAIILRSTVQVENLLPTAMNLYSSQAGKLSLLGTISAGDLYNIPVSLIQNNEVTSLVCKPQDYEHVSLSEELSLERVVMMANDGQEKLMNCAAKKRSSAEKIDNFYFNAFCKYTNVRYNNTHTVTPNSRVYQVLLKPVYSVANLLPVPLHLQVDGALEEGATLTPGGSASVCNARVAEGNLAFCVENFSDKNWVGQVALASLTDEMINLTMVAGAETLNLGVRNVKDQGTIFLSVYSPVWIMNKTGLSLSYKDPIIEHGPDMDAKWPVLFGGKTLNSKKRVAVKALDSEWSEKFSLDTVGSSGTLTCTKQDGSTAYEFGVSIKPTAAVLTRLVVITPYYLFNNDSDVDLEIREEHIDGKWEKVPKKATLPFWPRYLSKLICVKIAGTDDREMSTAFSYGVLQTLLLRLNNTYGGIYIQTQVSESNVTCSFSLYKAGTASALLINDIQKHSVKFRQITDTDDSVLQHQCQQLFTWPHPALERSFIWTIGQEQNKPLDLNRDDAGLCYLADGSPLFWVAFLDGVQRVLLFTDRQTVAHQCTRSLENEISNLEVNVALDAIGLSLVHNTIKREVLYLGIVSPGPIWMGRKVGNPGKKLKPMTVAESSALELAYQQYLMIKERDMRTSGKTPQSQIITEGDMEVTFDSTGPALMTRPKAREIQRTYQSGMWCRLRSSDHHTQFHLKLHRIQLDNPILGSRYPVVVFPVPLPSTADYKPFLEVSVVLRNAENSAVQQYKLLTALLQEFEFRLDQAFINSLVAMFSADITNGFQERTEMLESFRTNDLSEITRSLAATVAKGFGEERQAYYERLMLQPIKIHLSFSLTGGHVEKRSGMAMPAEFISLFIKSIGVTITEANDVVLKLGTFERDYRFISQKQLMGEVQSHYVAQVVKQIYMLVFGLDILGNPFGLVRGITDGVKDLFYEPYLGAVEGPDEFMAGLSTGLKNFVGSTLGGTMGAVGRVTGTLGRAMAALSFDQEFQERRQTELNRNAGDFAGGMASSGRHLLSGVVEGVTGVIRRPLEGAKEEGVEGFVKGLGKGLLGFVARPTTGLIDFASGSLNTIGRAVKGDNTVQWLRMPRFIPSDGIIRPYNFHQAEGGLVFRNLRNGEFAKTDEYITHLVTSRDRRYILMLTHKRVFCLEKGDVIHDWNIDWTIAIDQMPKKPNVDEKGLCLYTDTDHGGKPFGGLFSSRAEKSKRVFIEDWDSGKWFCAKVSSLWDAAHQDKS